MLFAILPVRTNNSLIFVSMLALFCKPCLSGIIWWLIDPAHDPALANFFILL